MKRKIFLTISSVIFIAGLVVLMLYLSFPTFFEHKSMDESQELTQLKMVEYPVLKGTIIHTYETEGKVISETPELYIVNYEVQNISDNNFELFKQNGETFARGDVIYTSHGKNMTVDFNGKIVDITYTYNKSKKNLSIKLLNYDALYIVTWVDSEQYQKINYSTSVKIISENVEQDATIKNIGYEVIDNQIPIQVFAPINALPGTKVKISFVLNTDLVGLYVPTSAVYHNGDSYYGFVKDGENRRQVEIEVGQEFSVEEDGTVFKYIEIISGVSESDTLIVEELSDYGTKLEEELAYE